MFIDKLIERKSDEDIVLIAFSHIAPYTPHFLLGTLLFILPWFFLFTLFAWGLWGVALFFLWMLGASIYLIRTYYCYRNTVGILTDRRIIDVEQTGLFERNSTEVLYEDIGDVSWQRKGIGATIFRYGNVRISVKGTSVELTFHRIIAPQMTHDIIQEWRAKKRGIPTNPTDRRVKKIADHLTPTEVERLEKKVEKREQAEAFKKVFSQNDPNL